MSSWGASDIGCMKPFLFYRSEIRLFSKTIIQRLQTFILLAIGRLTKEEIILNALERSHISIESKTIWSRSVKRNSADENNIWEDAKATAQNRVKWKNLCRSLFQKAVNIQAHLR